MLNAFNCDASVLGANVKLVRFCGQTWESSGQLADLERERKLRPCRTIYFSPGANFWTPPPLGHVACRQWAGRNKSVMIIRQK